MLELKLSHLVKPVSLEHKLKVSFLKLSEVAALYVFLETRVHVIKVHDVETKYILEVLFIGDHF